MILSEVISEAIAQRLLQAKAEKWGPGETVTVDSFYAEHNRLMREFLPVAQNALVPPEIRVGGRIGWLTERFFVPT